jgi:hypothetical protein
VKSGVIVQLFIDGAWVDITADDDVYTRDPISITRGRANEAGQVDASVFNFTLDNRDGVYSPRNPSSPYYGKIGRNTPARVRRPTMPALLLDGTTNSTASTPDTGVLDITGDIDLRAEFTLDAFTGTQCILAKGENGAGGCAYQLLVGFTGGVPHVTLRWSTNGVNEFHYDHDMAEIELEKRIAVRAYLDVNNGAGGRTAVFFTSDSIDGDWSVHGDPHVTAGTTSIASSNQPVTIGGQGAGDRFTGAVYAVRILNGIAGTEVANPDFEAQDLGDTSFTDDAGRTWTLAADAEIGLEPTTRVTGEVASFPVDWDPSGSDVYTEIEAAGILRRLGQGKAPAASAIREYLQDTDPDLYMPLDQSAGSTSFEVQTRSSIYPGQGDLGPDMPPGLRINTTSGGFLYRWLGQPAGPDEFTIDYLFKATQLGGLDFTVWTQSSSGVVDRFQVELRGDGVNNDVAIIIEEDYLNSGATSQVNSGVLDAITDGELHHVRFAIEQVGSDIDLTVYIDGALALTTTHLTYQLDAAYLLTVDYIPTTTNYVSLGHVVAWYDTAPDVAATALAVLNSRAGETAGRRIERLCAQAGIPFTAIGDLDDTAIMGPQGQVPLLDAIRDCETADMGVLYEPRDSLGLVYRTRIDLYNQTPATVLDYTAGVFSRSPKPVDDDQLTRNDVTVKRPNGGSYQAVRETGPLSIQDPPNGVGVYDTEETVNVVTDAHLPNQAAWRLNLGTIDEARYPLLAIPLHVDAVADDPVLSRALNDLDIGDALRLTDLPAWLPPDDVDVLAQGFTETIGTHTVDLEINCVPASPYDIAIYDADRYDTAGSELTVGVSTSATTLLVRSIETMWTTNDTMFPFDAVLGGERVTVTDIAGGEPTFVGVGTSATGNNASVTPGAPAGVAVGDVVLIFASIRNSGTGTVNLPTNWSEVAGSGTNARLMGRVWDGVWTMPLVTFTGGAASADTIAQSCAFRNVELNTGDAALNGSAQDIITAADSDPDSAGQWGVVILAGWKQDDWTSVAPVTGFAEIGEQVATAGSDAGQVWDYLVRRNGDNGLLVFADFTVTGGAAAISRGLIVFLPRAPQTFTVTRSVNGITKSHAAGTEVRLWDTPRYGLGGS